MFGKSEKMLEEFERIIESKFEQNLNYIIANSFNLYLEKFREMVDYEKEIIEKSSKETIEKINAASNQMFQIEEIISENKKMTAQVNYLIDEIRKRDAIIERKNKQIAKLKAEK